MDLLDKINSLTDDQLQMIAERDDASGVLAAYRLSEIRGLPYPDRSTVVLGEGYAIVAQGGMISRIPIDGGVSKIIREEGGNYCVYSEDGSRSFGCYPTLVEAENRLQQIHYFEIEDSTDKAETYSPPEDVQEAAQRAVDWIAEGHAGSGFTDVGRRRASQLANGDAVSEETIRRMSSYFARHEVDQQAEGWNLGEEGFPTPGRVAWDAWGGDPGKRWADSIVERLEPKQACPVATQNVTVNLMRRQTAIDVADYGPLNPAEPNDEYWEHIAEYFETSADEARKSTCGNCAAFDMTSHMQECIAGGIEGEGGDSEDPWDVIEAGDLGYCRVFKFKCAAARTCSAWIAGGPITDEDIQETRELSKATFLRKQAEQRFTLGPLYVPDFMDAHGEWTDSHELQTAVWGWVRGGDRRIFLQHDTDVVAGEWVEVMTMPQPWTVNMLGPNGEPIGEVTYPPNTVFLGVIWNEEAWELVKRGELRGYSIGGFSDRVFAELPEDGIRDGVDMPRSEPVDLAKSIAEAVAAAMKTAQPVVNVVLPESKATKVRRIERDEHGNIARIIEEDE
jgi:hypothetical protein